MKAGRDGGPGGNGRERGSALTLSKKLVKILRPPQLHHMDEASHDLMFYIENIGATLFGLVVLVVVWSSVEKVIHFIRNRHNRRT